MKLTTKALTYDDQRLEAEHVQNESIIQKIKDRIASDTYDNIKKPIPLVKQLQGAR